MATNIYETERVLNEYLLFHYGTREDVMPFEFGPRDAVGFPARCVRECLDTSMLPAGARALDLGCAVGRSSFELARHCAEVVGIDNSQTFIRAAVFLKKAGRMGFDRIEEGMLTTRCVVELPENIDRARVHFEVGDALKLRSTLGDFDVVLAANLLCRLEDPLQLLLKFPHLVRPGGQLIIASPYTWSKDFTPMPKWLGGYEREDRKFETFVTLQKFLAPDFDFLRERDLPWLIREHARKYQWGVSQACCWRRKDSV